MGEMSDIWKPLSVSEVTETFNKIPIHWWIAGGWALDIYLGEETRGHEDIDIVILRRDHLPLKKYLYDDWIMYKATKGQFIEWEKNDELDIQYDNIWVKQRGSSTWAFQVMILDTVGEEWIYKRKNTVRKALKNIGHKSSGGVPYLRPEIQLLYKGGSSVLREKDHIDLKNVLPKLTNADLTWLKDSLAEQFPKGHPWITYVTEMITRKSTY
ncbi:hypothetical protein LGQ02_10370 [Bacillus shivajii]|uniref:nucleotidyltransferase domain-containing protein n=1 Tax=Bacillus shivajii TaxID=1983719 RepID=UPI001CF9BDE4|nr:hypothetical protein [Bacillus shivajii]UCZ55094.1 hypothetical protein LGQ02_10370 [Bacillus shivajii]